jgi:peptide/nickel transport system ATP-binding protein/oligopeptide transport system ATP-binding protein
MTMNQGALLDIRNLRTVFRLRGGEVPAVDGIDLSVGAAEIVGLVGESGSGKSVTSLSVMRLVASPGRIDHGEILFDGKDLTRLPDTDMLSIRGKAISMIFQEPMTSLNPVYRVGKQVSEALLIHGNAANRAEARRKTIEMFTLVGIPEPESRYDVYPHQLSGGLRQRVMIAMALVCKPRLIIADEPTTALDVTIEAQILKLMKDLRTEVDTSILLISHNLGVIAEICDRVYVMYAGRIMEHADVYELFDHPLHPYTNGLLRSMPRRDIETSGTRLYSIPGNIPNVAEIPAGCRFAPRCGECFELCRTKEPELIEVAPGHSVRCWKYARSGENDA